MTRDEVRAKIFSSENKRFKTKTIDLFGAPVELRQPTLGMILEAQQSGDRKLSLMRLLVDYCYVPGTEEKVFELTDMDSLMAMPFSEDLMRVNTTIAELTNIDVMSAEGNSDPMQGDSMS